MSQNNLSNFENLVLDVIKNNEDQELSKKQIEHILQLNSNREQKRLQKALNRLKNQKLIYQSGQQFGFRSRSDGKKVNDNSVTGKLDISAGGTGYLITEEYDEDIRISNRDLGLALNDDTVRIKLLSGGKGSRQKGVVEEIIKRGKEFYVGTLSKTGDNNYLIETDHKSVYKDFFVLPENIGKAEHGDKVVFKLKNWVHPKALPEAEITSVLGKEGTNNANVLSILAEHDMVVDFPSEVEKYVKRIPVNIPEEEFGRRNDMRDQTVFTIDPLDAKDFDDALSIKMLDNGNYYLGVHIADVTHYVRPDSVLDEEAYHRGTSVYLVDRVVPMLPEKLSNGVCSLRPHEDKLTYSCFMEMDPKGNLQNYSIEETVIHSDQRFTYEEAQEIIEGKPHKLDTEVQMAAGLAKTLMVKRFKEGAIDFDTPEPRFVLDDDGAPLKVILKERLFAHRLVEECMLMANKTVAQHVENLRRESGKKKNKNLFPFFYRIHDKPDIEKLENIAEQVKPIGIQFEVGKNISPKNINNLLRKVEDTNLEYIVNGLMLRSMAKAEYSPNNIGHFGLGFKHYTHFTSPIRRYPDVIVHRMLKSYQNGVPSYTYDKLKENGEHCSERERNAVEAERDSVKLKQVEFLSSRIGESFEGVISGVMEKGIFINLKHIHCEGMIRMSDLKSDYFVYDPKSHSLVGRKSKKRYQLGDEIMVEVKSTNLSKRQIDFVLPD